MLVVKIGGAAGIDYAPLCADLAVLVARGERIVLCHGGSDGASQLGERLDHPPQFVVSPSGHTSRLTDRTTLEIFIMATGLLNRQLVERLHGLGINALGLSGLDGGLLRGTRKSTAIRAAADGASSIWPWLRRYGDTAASDIRAIGSTLGSDGDSLVLPERPDRYLAGEEIAIVTAGGSAK